MITALRFLFAFTLKLSFFFLPVLLVLFTGEFAPISANLQQSNLGPRPVSVLITPHHLLAEKQIHHGFSRTRDEAKRAHQKIERIVLMGPNHFFRGKAKVITTDLSWKTPFGEVTSDPSFRKLLTAQNLASLEPGIVEGDHSITALLPFIEQYFPDVKVTPLLFREPMNEEETKVLAKWLMEKLDNRTLIIASIDFSHYLPKFVANIHDQATLAALSNLDFEFFQKNVDADARQILMVLAEYLKLKNHHRFTLLEHTNSADLANRPEETMTTSHIVGFFQEGPMKSVQRMVIIFQSRDDGNPLLYKGGDFHIIHNRIASCCEFKKNGIQISIDRDAEQNKILFRGDAALILEKSYGNLRSTLCFFDRRECI